MGMKEREHSKCFLNNAFLFSFLSFIILSREREEERENENNVNAYKIFIAVISDQ